MHCTIRFVKQHWPFALLATLGLWLVLANLGSDYLWEDEGDTAVLASNILKFGVPKAWDGVTFTESDKGARLNNDLVMVSHPWAQYYVAAGSFLLLGESTFAARLPFALAGWLTIVLAYVFVWRITGSRATAFSAAALLVLSVQFLIYCRQCRNYPLNMFVTCGLIWSFFRMRSARQSVLFALVAILLFHTHPIGVVPVGVLGILTLIYRPFCEQRRWFWFALPVILIFTLPWLFLAHTGYRENVDRLQSVTQLFGRFVQYLIESASVTPLIGCAVLLLILWATRWRIEKKPARAEVSPEKNEAALVVVTFALLFCYGLPIALTERSNSIWGAGLRHVPALIPLMAMTAAILIARVSRGRTALWLPLLLVFGLTKLAQLTPWAFGDRKLPVPKPGTEFIALHGATKVRDSFLCGEDLMFLRDLWKENPGTVAHTCKFLRQFAQSDDKLISNYGWESLYFYTRLPQALKILPSFPIYEVARRKGLPSYVFEVDHVRWIVWRLAWEGYEGYRWREVEAEILAKGGRVTQVAEFNETCWENRETIFSRRFAGNKYVYPWPESFPPAGVFRVDWPDATAP